MPHRYEIRLQGRPAAPCPDSFLHVDVCTTDGVCCSSAAS